MLTHNELLLASEVFWRSLRYFNFYRLFIACFLVLIGSQVARINSDFSVADVRTFRISSFFYLFACIASIAWLRQKRAQFNLQLSVLVLVDVVALLVMMHASGGVRSGLGVLLLVSLAAAGLVGQGRMVLFFASLATLGLLFEQFYFGLRNDFDGAGPAFFQAGLFSLAFFATAISARLLARRVLASEELARRRGKDLSRQLRLTTRVIAMLDDGVLVVSPSGDVVQASPRAREFLSLGSEEGSSLSIVWPELAHFYVNWTKGEPDRSLEMRFAPTGVVLSIRFLPVDASGGDSLILLQDVGLQRNLAQRMKLAALGRLTANIAHEIRNPLSSIRHATELLVEDVSDRSSQRLLQIVLDNTQRLDRIVCDVLELGRRDKVQRNLIVLLDFLPIFVQQFEASQKINQSVIVLQPIHGALLFDVTHLHQVLWNLLVNAVRYASGRAGSIVLCSSCEPVPTICVIDDGPGVSSENVLELFEPFVTTHAQGNGLGLFVARELCEANGASLMYEVNPSGACFVLRGDS